MSNEARLWDYLRINMNRNWHANRIESHDTAPGFPDVEYCIKSFMSTLELKYTGGKTPPNIRNSQIKWHWKRHLQGGKSFILTEFNFRKTHDGGSIYLLHAGRDVRELAIKTTFQEWRDMAFMRWSETIDFDEFKMAIGNQL